MSQTLSILHFVSLIDLHLVHKTRIVFDDRMLILAKLKQLVQVDTNDEGGVEEVVASVQGILCKMESPPFRQNRVSDKRISARKRGANISGQGDEQESKIPLTKSTDHRYGKWNLQQCYSYRSKDTHHVQAHNRHPAQR